MSFLKVFKQPHHSSTLSVRGLIHAAVVSILVALTAFVFKPFGLKEASNTVFGSIGGVTLAMMLLAQFVFPAIARDFYKEESWTVGKQLTQLLIMSFFVSFGVIYFLSTQGLTSFPIDAFLVFGISVLPLIGLVLIQNNILDSKFQRLASDKNSDLKHKSVVSSDNPLNVLSFKGRGANLNLIPNQLIYVKCSGGVSEFYFQNFFGVEKSTINILEKEVLAELKSHPQFEILGDGIVVNTNAIQKISGSARGYDVVIAKINEELKVSHRYSKKVEKL